MLQGEFYQGGNMCDPQFCHQSAAIGFDTLGRKGQDYRSFSTVFSFNNELEHLAFMAGKTFERSTASSTV